MSVGRAAGAATGPFWAPPPPRPPAALPRRVEALVVGGGITGVCLLRGLRARGVEAVLVERRHLAAEASGANAGFLLSGVTDCYAAAVRRLGRDVAAAVWAATRENHELLLAALGEAGRRLAGHRRRGAWTLASDGTEAEDLRQSEVLLDEDGLPGRWVDDPPGTPLGCRGGLLVADDGEIDPAAAVAALAAPLPDAAVVEGVDVVGLEPGAAEVRVATSAGEVVAARVLLALNAWTTELAPALPVAPVRAQMLATAAQPPRPVRRPVYAQRGHRYWRQLESGELLVGGCRDLAIAEEAGSDPTPTDRVQAALDAELRRLQAQAPVTHRWAGIMGFTPDGLPLVGAVPGMPGVEVCAGYTGHGMGLAAWCADRLAAAVSGAAGPPPPAWLDPGRFPAGTSG